MHLFKLVCSFLDNVHPGVELLGHMVVLFSVCFFFFPETSVLLSAVATPICIPAKSVRGSPFSTSSPVFAICVLFGDSHSDRCGVTSQCSFGLHFPDD